MAVPAFLKSRTTILALLVGLAGILAILYAWRLPPFTTAVETTDDAYVRGAVTTLGSQVTGIVAAVHVTDFQKVGAGNPLLELDDRIYRQKLAQAKAGLADAEASLASFDTQRRAAEAQVRVGQAQVQSAEAALKGARASETRLAPLIEKNFATEAQGTDVEVTLGRAEAGVAQAQASQAVAEQQVRRVEASRANLEAAVAGAQAAVELAEIDLGNSRILAPQAGRLGEVRIRPGQYVAVGTQLVSLVPPELWVIANYKETQIAAMHRGQPVTIRVDALRGAVVTGRIQRFSPAAGSEFSVLRADNATGNFIKIAQRIPVRIELDPGQTLLEALSPGMSVVVSIDTSVNP